MDTFLIDSWLNPPKRGAIQIMARVFRNSVLRSHLHAAPSTNIYLRILYCCVRREAVPPFSSSLSLPPLILPPWSVFSVPSLCSQLVSSPEVNSSLVGPVPSLCIPLPRLMLPWRSTQERGTCPPLSANSP